MRVVCHTFPEEEEVKSKLTFGYLVILSCWPFNLFHGKDDCDEDDGPGKYEEKNRLHVHIHVFSN